MRSFLNLDIDHGHFRNEKDVLDEYVSKGVSTDMVFLTKDISVTYWNVKKRTCQDRKEHMQLTQINNGGLAILGCEDSVIISLMCYNDLDKEMVDKINNSAGIIATTHAYKSQRYKFRFGFIPESLSEQREKKLKHLLN